MSKIYWVEPKGPFHSADGAAFNTFTAFQDISPTPAIILPANILEIGSEIRIEAWGEFSNTGTPTLGLGLYYGTAATSLGTGTAITTTTSAVSWPWHVLYIGRVRAVGTSGSINGQGAWEIGTSLTAFSTRQALSPTLAGRTVTIDTTAAKAIGVGAVWGTSSASNTIKVNSLSVQLVS